MTFRTYDIVSVHRFAAIAFLSVLAFSVPARAVPIVVDNTASSANVPSSTQSGTITNFTVPNTALRALVVTVGGEVSTPVQSVTFGSQSFVEADTAIFGSTMSSIWYLLSPNATTADITVTRTASGGNGWAFGALSMSNVAQQAPITSTLTSPTSGVLVNPIVTTENDSMIVEALAKNGSGGVTPQAGQTLFFSTTSLAGGAGTFGAFDFEPLAGLHNQQWNFSSSDRNTLVAAAFASAFVPEPSSGVIMLLGMNGWLALRRRRRLKA